MASAKRVGEVGGVAGVAGAEAEELRMGAAGRENEGSGCGDGKRREKAAQAGRHLGRTEKTVGPEIGGEDPLKAKRFAARPPGQEDASAAGADLERKARLRPRVKAGELAAESGEAGGRHRSGVGKRGGRKEGMRPET